MLALKKAWIWIKKHWYVPVLFVLVIVGSAFSFSRNKKLIKMLEINKESYEKQIKSLTIEKDKVEKMLRDYQSEVIEKLAIAGDNFDYGKKK